MTKKSTSNRTRRTTSFRVGKVRAFLRGRVWYLYYHEHGKRHQPRVGPDKDQARQMAAEINAQLEVGAPSALGFEPISIPELRQRWLDHHENVRRSSLRTINRYRTATQHLLDFLRDARPLKRVSEAIGHQVAAVRISGPLEHGSDDVDHKLLPLQRPRLTVRVAVGMDLHGAEVGGQFQTELSIDTGGVSEPAIDVGTGGKRKVVAAQGGGIPRDRAIVDLAAVRPAFQVFQVSLNQLFMIELAHNLACGTEVIQALLNLPGSREGREQVSVDAIR